MNFNSAEFLVFLPVVLVLYAVVFRRPLLRDVLLLVSSYVFYMSWNWRYAGLILLSTLIDYYVGRRLGGEERPGHRRVLLVVSMSMNLGLLGVFKYYNFFVDLAAGPLSVLGLDLGILRHELLLPVGISFYTFQTMSYTIDVYRRKIPVEPSLLKFAVFVSFFPQLVAGPIVRAADFLPQLRRTPPVSESGFQTGLVQMFRGLFKKIVIADLLAGLGVDAVFADPSAHSSITLLLALYGYSFQIYNDFSGYSDIAIGVGRMMGFDLPVNFNRPYLATNVRDFWARWHISLSTWLRDYLYIPLGGNRGNRLRTARNLMITMLLGGLWHGAALNFVFWGAWHGLLLVVSRGQPRTGVAATGPRLWAARLWCFHLVTFSWLLFRVGSVGTLAEYLSGLFAFTGGTPLSGAFLAVLTLAFVAHFTPQDLINRTLSQVPRLPVPVQAGGYAALLLVFMAFSFGAPAFIYFQF